jgi:hypothetical protein
MFELQTSIIIHTIGGLVSAAEGDPADLKMENIQAVSENSPGYQREECLWVTLPRVELRVSDGLLTKGTA